MLYSYFALKSRPDCKTVKPIENDSAIILFSILSCIPFAINFISYGAT